MKSWRRNKSRRRNYRKKRGGDGGAPPTTASPNAVTEAATSTPAPPTPVPPVSPQAPPAAPGIIQSFKNLFIGPPPSTSSLQQSLNKTTSKNDSINSSTESDTDSDMDADDRNTEIPPPQSDLPPKTRKHKQHQHRNTCKIRAFMKLQQKYENCSKRLKHAKSRATRNRRNKL